MPPRLPPNLLDRSAQESARLLALNYLDQIDRAERRLATPSDKEALHDFRVGLRRLRSSLSAYRTELEDSVTPSMRRRVRDLARATSEGRDAEVQLEWLGKQAERLAAEDVPGFFWLVGRLEDRKQATLDQTTAEVSRKYHKPAGKLRRALGVLTIELQAGQGATLPTFREVTGALTIRQVARLRHDLGAIAGSSDVDQAHRARISLKRLRYLLEPIARRNRRAAALVRLFREAQDLLGEHHDMHILSGAMASLRSELSGNGAGRVEPGLATLVRLADEAAAAAFERFQSLWSDDMAGWILTRAEELGRSLEEQLMPAGNGARPAPAEPVAPEPPRLTGQPPMITGAG